MSTNVEQAGYTLSHSRRYASETKNAISLCSLPHTYVTITCFSFAVAPGFYSLPHLSVILTFPYSSILDYCTDYCIYCIWVPQPGFTFRTGAQQSSQGFTTIRLPVLFRSFWHCVVMTQVALVMVVSPAVCYRWGRSAAVLVRCLRRAGGWLAPAILASP